MYEVSGDLTVTQIIIWWWQKLGRLAVRKQEAQKSDGERFNLRKLKDLEARKQYQIKITNRFAALENVSDDENINRAWESVKETIKTSAKESLGLQEMEQHKPWFDEECLGILDERKQAIRQWIQDPSQSNVDNLNNVRRDASRYFRNKKKAYLRAKIKELETNSKINNIRDLYRGINYFKKGYQPRTIIVKDEKGDLVADFRSIMARWRNYFSQLLNIHGASDDRQAEIHTAEPLVPEPSYWEVESAIKKLKSHKSPGMDQIPAELIKAGGETLCCAIHKLIISIWNKEELPEEWKESIIVPIYKKGDKADCNNYRGISLLPTTYKIMSNILLSRLIPYAEEIIVDHQCGFRSNRSTTDHIFCIRQILEKKWEYNEPVHQLFIDFKKAYDSVRREALYKILIEFGIPKKLVKLIKMCLTETYSRVRVGKNLSETFPIRNGLKQGDALSPLLFNLALDYAIRRVQEKQDGLKLNGTHQLLAYADDVNILGGSVHTVKENAEALVAATKEIGLEVNADKTKYMVMSREGNAGQGHSVKIDNSAIERVEEFKYLGVTLTGQNSTQEEIKSRLKLWNACYYSVQNPLSSRSLSKNLKSRIYKTIILPVVLYGCEAWPLTLREEHRLRVFENRVLRRVFGPKRDEVTGEWRKLHNEELKDLYPSPSIVQVVKSRRMRWAGHVARMGEERGVHRVLVGKPEGKRPVGRPRRRWEDNIKMDLQHVGGSRGVWMELAQDRDGWRALVNTVMNLRVP